MTDREYRLRLRIDLLADRVEALTRDRDYALAAMQTARLQRDRWRAKCVRRQNQVGLWKKRAIR